ncbi:MAG: transposase [Ginsengibacter sp.]
MSTEGYKITDQAATYFVSFAVVGWVDVFTRKDYRDIVVDSLKYCQLNKGLVIYAWCIMSNHVHLIISSKENDISKVLGEFKKFTSKQIIDSILNHAGESRKEWMIKIFKEAGELNSRNKDYQFWQQDNQPKEIFTNEFATQKLEYIPARRIVQAGIITRWKQV